MQRRGIAKDPVKQIVVDKPGYEEILGSRRKCFGAATFIPNQGNHRGIRLCLERTDALLQLPVRDAAAVQDDGIDVDMREEIEGLLEIVGKQQLVRRARIDGEVFSV